MVTGNCLTWAGLLIAFTYFPLIQQKLILTPLILGTSFHKMFLYIK